MRNTIALTAVLSFGTVATAAGQFCTGDMSHAQCSQRLFELTYEGWVAAEVARRACPKLAADDRNGLIRDAENKLSERERSDLITRKYAVIRRFAEDRRSRALRL